MVEPKPFENGRISYGAVLNSLATLAVVAIATFVWGMKEDVSDMKTEIALLKQQVSILVERDIPSRGEVRAIVDAQVSSIRAQLVELPYPWKQERDEWMKWRSEVNARLKGEK